MNAVRETRFCFLKTSRELKNVSSKNYVRSDLNSISIICQKQMKV